MASNAKGKEIQKAILSSIKERVYRNHTKSYKRREKQLKDVKPPTTFEIYTMNHTSRTLRNSFTLVSPVVKKPDPNHDPSTGKTP